MCLHNNVFALQKAYFFQWIAGYQLKNFFFFFFPLLLFCSCILKEMNESIAKAYPYANTNRPKEYYDYESLQVKWG